MRNKPTLCWNCEKALGGCEWSDRFAPVPGWKATPTILKTSRRGYPAYKEIDSFLVTECPKFVEG